MNEELQKLSPIINLTGLSLLIAVKAQGSKLWFDKKKLSFHELMNENVIDDKIQFRTGAFLSLIITHIECPILEDDDITPKVVKAQNKVNQAGYDFQMLDY